MDDDKTADYLAQEYLFLQKTIEDFDGRALTVKAWSVTFSGAALGLAYQQHIRILLLLASASAIVFWLVETVWKYHQRAYYPRIYAIEEWFAKRSEKLELAPFQISGQWTSELPSNAFGELYRTGLFSMVANPFGIPMLSRPSRPTPAIAVPFFLGVMLPHIVVCAAGILLYFFGPKV